MTSHPGCTCERLQAPELFEEFGPGVTVEVLKVNPDCPVHTGPPDPLCQCCTDDYGPCTCAKPCGAITCSFEARSATVEP